MSDRITIRDLAKLAGVSTATVSLALRDSHEVSPATREKIQALAQKHNYRSHPAVSTLMQQVRSGGRIYDEETIAFIRTGKDAGENATGPLELLAGAEQEAFRLGYRIETFWAGYLGAKAEQLGRMLYHRGIRGVIWGPMPYPHPPLVFPWEHFVPIACTNSTDVANLPIVSIHHTKGMSLLLEQLEQRGAMSIGFLVSEIEELRHDFAWRSGVDIYHYRGGKAKTLYRTTRQMPSEKSMRAWVDEHEIDTLVVSHFFYEQTHFLADQLARASLDVPTTDLGRVGGLYQEMGRIGQHAVRSMSVRLTNSIMGLPENAFSVVTQAVFRDGESLAPLGKTGATERRGKIIT